MFHKCGSVVGGDDPDFQGVGHHCPNKATRISHLYESLSAYVCDIDHEGLEPWLENTIEDLPDAAETRAT